MLKRLPVVHRCYHAKGLVNKGAFPSHSCEVKPSRRNRNPSVVNRPDRLRADELKGFRRGQRFSVTDLSSRVLGLGPQRLLIAAITKNVLYDGGDDRRRQIAPDKQRGRKGDAGWVGGWGGGGVEPSRAQSIY